MTAMFQRYKDYIPLARYEHPDQDRHKGFFRHQEPGWKRRALLLAFYALSLGINAYFIYKTLTKWPAPLDNYQSL